MREGRFKTNPHRWGDGVVHRYLYDRVNKLWYCACRGVNRGDPHGVTVHDRTPVTCKRCLKGALA